MRVLYPDLSKDIKFPRRAFRPKILPNKEQLKIFYDNLPSQYKVIFLLLASSGLRVGELLDAEIDFNNRMIVPQSHNGSTKHSWISFFNTECIPLLSNGIPEITVDGLSHLFLKTSKKCRIKIYPHLLRSVFAREMSKGRSSGQIYRLFLRSNAPKRTGAPLLGLFPGSIKRDIQ